MTKHTPLSLQRILLPVLCALGLCLAGAAHAQTDWAGTVNSNWFTVANWTAGVPTNTVGVEFEAPAVSKPAYIDSSATAMANYVYLA